MCFSVHVDPAQRRLFCVEVGCAVDFSKKKTFCLHLKAEVSLDVSVHANYVGVLFILEVRLDDKRISHAQSLIFLI
jgi:hypothetical protein